MATVALVLGGTRLRLVADKACQTGLQRFARAWSSAPTLSEEDPVDSMIDARREPESGQVVVQAGAFREVDEFALADCHFSLERAVYHELARLLPEGRRTIHAGCVSGAGGSWVFLGASGAGKSSLCLGAVKKGYRYLSDDILVTDGQVIWGVPRAIQFDAPREGVPFPSWLRESGLDFATYPGAGPSASEEEDNSCPLFIPGRKSTLDEIPAIKAHIVVLERGEESELTPIPGAEALGHLLSAAHAPPRDVDLGKLVQGGAYRLRWKSPGEALELLETQAQRGPA